MNLRPWILVGTVIDGLLLLPGVFMAIQTVDLAQRSDGSAEVIALVVLFFALPVFCLAAPLAAWRAHKRHKDDLNPLFLLACPLVYAVFLVVFVFSN
jgi:hypothetical protein